MNDLTHFPHTPSRSLAHLNHKPPSNHRPGMGGSVTVHPSSRHSSEKCNLRERDVSAFIARGSKGFRSLGEEREEKRKRKEKGKGKMLTDKTILADTRDRRKGKKGRENKEQERGNKNQVRGKRVNNEKERGNNEKVTHMQLCFVATLRQRDCFGRVVRCTQQLCDKRKECAAV